MTSQPSFVVARPPAQSAAGLSPHSFSHGAGNSLGPSAAASRPFGRASVFADDEDDGADDDDHNRAGAGSRRDGYRGSGRSRPAHRNGIAISSLGGEDSDPTARSKSKEAPALTISQDHLTADDAARKALLEELRANKADSGTSGTNDPHSNLVISMTEEEALRMDLDSRPEAPGAAAYEAVPVEAFGAAMLRGMGWKEGMGAGRKRNGPQHAPEVSKRAALLGLGAKERPAPEDVNGSSNAGRAGSSSQPRREARPDMRYVPVVQRVRDREGPSTAAGSRESSQPASGTSTPRDRSNYGEDRHDRRREQSPPPRRRDRDRERGWDRDWDRDRDRRDTREISSREHRSNRDYHSRDKSSSSRRDDSHRSRDRTSERSHRDSDRYERHQGDSRHSYDRRDGTGRSEKSAR
ncbi:DNA primase large subunit Spp2 [Tilletia horrida]|nr:DNA primase large subunit Spp2 [Tilletia horrida]